MEIKKLKEILKLHAMWLKGTEHGKRANLKDVNLERANLKDANLECVNLEGANLKDANLERANLERANLKDVNLEGANLECANLERANLERANLECVNLKGANLDFSCFPLWCGGLNIKVCDRLVSQLFYHIASFDISACSHEIREKVEEIKKDKKFINNFRKYRSDIKKL